MVCVCLYSLHIQWLYSVIIWTEYYYVQCIIMYVVLHCVSTVFALNVTCGGVRGEGDFTITLNSTVDNSTQQNDTVFVITKDCGK